MPENDKISTPQDIRKAKAKSLFPVKRPRVSSFNMAQFGVATTFIGLAINAAITGTNKTAIAIFFALSIFTLLIALSVFLSKVLSQVHKQYSAGFKSNEDTTNKQIVDKLRDSIEKNIPANKFNNTDILNLLISYFAVDRLGLNEIQKAIQNLSVYESKQLDAMVQKIIIEDYLQKTPEQRDKELKTRNKEQRKQVYEVTDQSKLSERVIREVLDKKLVRDFLEEKLGEFQQKEMPQKIKPTNKQFILTVKEPRNDHKEMGSLPDKKFKSSPDKKFNSFTSIQELSSNTKSFDLL